jgi:hypothetical protein
VAAARWDIPWDRGGGWRRRLIRKDTTGAVIGIGSPCVMELRRIYDPSSVAAAATVTATVDTDGTWADLLATRELIESLPLERYQHRIVVPNLVSGEPEVLARGYVSIRDTVEG